MISQSDTLRVAMICDHAGSGVAVDGGVQAVSQYLIDALVATGDVELHVITFRYDIDEMRTQREDGYVHYQIPGPKLGTATLYWQSQTRLRTLLGEIKPHIVHAQGAGHDGVVAVRSGLPAVVTIHGILQEESRHFSQLRRRLRHRLQNIISKHYCIRRAQHTILISPYVEEYWGRKLGGRRHMIPNPVAPAFFDVERAPVRGRILFAGRLRPLKGVADLLAAAVQLGKTHDLSVVLAGSTRNTAYLTELKGQAERGGIAEDVNFAGILDGQSLRAELAQASMLVLPSYQETAPMVIQEAMAAGVPVVATSVGGIPHQIENNRTGLLVEPGDVSALTSAVARLLDDDALRLALSNAAKRRAEAHYHADSVARKTIDTYRNIFSTVDRRPKN